MATRDNAQTQDGSPSADGSMSDSFPESTGQTLSEKVLSLARRITSLAENDEDVEIEDPELGHRVGLSVKPYVDRLVALSRLLTPVDRIIENRDQIDELRGEIAEDVASVEDASQDLGEIVDTTLITELQTELAAVRRDRKLFAEQDEDGGDEDGLAETIETDSEQDRRLGRVPFLERPTSERLRLILGSRFIDLDRLASVFGAPLPDDEIDIAGQRVERVWEGLMEIERFRDYARQEQLRPLRRALRDYVLIYRTRRLPGPDGAVSCSISRLRDCLPARFVGSSEHSLWYSSLPFYHDSFPEGHWALLDKQYQLHLQAAQDSPHHVRARANALPAETLRQKSVLEDVYDRAVVDAATDTLFFDSCNSLTRTTYQQHDEPTKKQVHVYYRDGQIRISGKRGVPHWRPGKPRWPGVLPAVVFDQPRLSPWTKSLDNSVRRSVLCRITLSARATACS
jgi:hypothetical protein